MSSPNCNKEKVGKVALSKLYTLQNIMIKHSSHKKNIEVEAQHFIPLTSTNMDETYVSSQKEH